MNAIPSSSFEYIVRQILKNRCVPVAGAGVSISSSHPDGEKVHNVSWMVRSLKAELIKKRYQRFDESKHGFACMPGCASELKEAGYKLDSNNLIDRGCFFCDVLDAANGYRLGNLSELFLWEYDDIDEAYKALVNLLRIDEYNRLFPTPAHIFIARLAREGLLSEVITTNYDCSFENAYDQASGGENTDVISSLGGYRRCGAKGGEVNRLKVFKVNGCAKNLGSSSDARACESILLTERQLQKWTNRQWAADVFKDRLRSKSLFFVGFGSDEPQIHHTVQAVLDEYTDDFENSGSNILGTYSAPIVAIYEPQPSFHQQQIVKTYALHHKLGPQQGDKLIVRNPEPGVSLSADELWASIYERVVRSLIYDAVQYSQRAENASFTAVVPFSSMILGQVLTSLEKSENKDTLHGTEAPDWLAMVRSVGEVEVENGRHYGPLASCVSILKGGRLGEYHPVTENKSIVSELVLVIFLLHCYLQERIESDKGSGLLTFFSKTNEDDTIEKSLYLNADPSLLAVSKRPSCSAVQNTLAIMLGNAGVWTRPSLRRSMSFDEDLTSVSPSNIVMLGWKHIFSEMPYGASVEMVRDTIIDAVKSPTNFYYKSQPSINRRSYLKPIKRVDGENED